jgi:hypothetical protein
MQPKPLADVGAENDPCGNDEPQNDDGEDGIFHREPSPGPPLIGAPASVLAS